MQESKKSGIMKRPISLLIAIALAGAVGHADDPPFLEGRIVAPGIPGISAVSPVGTLLPGGPFHDNPAFAAYTQPCRVPDRARILIGSTSNFGEPVVNAGQLPGSFLSIDLRSPIPLVIPPQFAARGGQASALGGFVQMDSAQSAPFVNSINNPTDKRHRELSGWEQDLDNADGPCARRGPPGGQRIGTAGVLGPGTAKVNLVPLGGGWS
jgi:hypothetical protein